MSHHCPFPVRLSDNRCGYRAGSAPGFTLSLALVAALSGMPASAMLHRQRQ